MSARWRLRLGAVAALLLLLFGAVSMLWTPYPLGGLAIEQALQGSSGAHWLGTDQLGRDALSLLMKAMLTSIVVAAVGAAIAAIGGVGLGLMAARWGGRIAFLIVEASEFFYAFSALVMAALFAVAFGPGAGVSMVAAGLYGIPVFTRATHAAAIALAAHDYVDAGRLAGLGMMDLWRRHVAPELFRLALAVTLEVMAMAVMAEAAIAYVGIGTRPPATSLGLMLRDGQANAMAEPLLVVLPGLAVMAMVLALNVMASGLRGLLEPALRRIGEVHGAT